MIEILSASRCVSCDVCVRICPDEVFDAVPGEAPVIARQGDCQTCFLCELYCPVDALYVSPHRTPEAGLTESAVEAAGLFGSYARVLGWANGKPPRGEASP